MRLQEPFITNAKKSLNFGIFYIFHNIIPDLSIIADNFYADAFKAASNNIISYCISHFNTDNGLFHI